MRFRSVSALAVSVTTVIALSLSPTDASSSAAATACSSPTQLGPAGAVLGPLRIRMFEGGDQAQDQFKPGYPSKVLLGPRRRWVGGLSLRGRRCSDGRPLRFAYDETAFPLPPPPLSQEDFARAGTLVARLAPPPRHWPLSGFGYAGYMLFSDEGVWRVSAFLRGRFVGALTVSVTPFRR